MKEDTRKRLIGFSSKEIAALPELREEASYRARQIATWIYRKSAQRFEDMSNISKGLRDRLATGYTLERLEVEETRSSADGRARKLLLRLPDGLRIEAVLIRESARDTICVSTQAGCGHGCRFCATARMGLQRNLTPHEILSQALILRDGLRRDGGEGFFNLVFMGMGEPLANYEAVQQTIRILTDDHGLGIGRRRITLSTVGLAPQMRRFAEEGIPVRMALSLNATTNEVRSRLMPINKRYPIEMVLEALGQYRRLSGSRTTLEYVLIRDVNDTHADARQLARYARETQSTINLIAFNPHPLCELQAPPPEKVAEFHERLLPEAPTVTLRESRGGDILAACGQLSTLHSAGEREQD